MAVNSESEKTVLRLWLLLRRVGDALMLCQDSIFGQYGLTTEQWGVLTSIKSRGPLRPTDLASILERSANSISMLVDRMVKAGLVRRIRDRSDRRVVHVVNTSKGENALKPATQASLAVIRKILPQSYEDKSTLLSLLGTIKYEILTYLNPEMDIEEVKREELEQAANVKEWLNKYDLSSTPQVKR
ncbi:MAG TPA: MarR family transcriptional regulator [Dehalococcoidia bacterium]|nr:MarR family transcriptional regulator [Dehalococcoidia bacterium]